MKATDFFSGLDFTTEKGSYSSNHSNYFENENFNEDYPIWINFYGRVENIESTQESNKSSIVELSKKHVKSETFNVLSFGSTARFIDDLGNKISVVSGKLFTIDFSDVSKKYFPDPVVLEYYNGIKADELANLPLCEVLNLLTSIAEEYSKKRPEYHRVIVCTRHEEWEPAFNLSGITVSGNEKNDITAKAARESKKTIEKPNGVYVEENGTYEFWSRVGKVNRYQGNRVICAKDAPAEVIEYCEKLEREIEKRIKEWSEDFRNSLG